MIPTSGSASALVPVVAAASNMEPSLTAASRYANNLIHRWSEILKFMNHELLKEMMMKVCLVACAVGIVLNSTLGVIAGVITLACLIQPYDNELRGNPQQIHWALEVLGKIRTKTAEEVAKDIEQIEKTDKAIHTKIMSAIRLLNDHPDSPQITTEQRQFLLIFNPQKKPFNQTILGIMAIGDTPTATPAREKDAKESKAQV